MVKVDPTMNDKHGCKGHREGLERRGGDQQMIAIDTRTEGARMGKTFLKGSELAGAVCLPYCLGDKFRFAGRHEKTTKRGNEKKETIWIPYISGGGK